MCSQKKRFVDVSVDPPQDVKGATDWSDDGAPFASQKFHPAQLLWFPFLAFLTVMSIQGLNDKSIGASLLWIVYECYIVFDHAPFLATNSVYKSPRFNFTHLSSIFFWGLESIASIVVTQSAVNAPNILLYNVAPHCFFVLCNNFRGVAASKSFEVEKQKRWWVCLQVFVDTMIHSISLWYHLEYFLSQVLLTADANNKWKVWISLIASMLSLTSWVHNEEMSFRYFLAPFRFQPPSNCGRLVG